MDINKSSVSTMVNSVIGTRRRLCNKYDEDQECSILDWAMLHKHEPLKFKEMIKKKPLKDKIDILK
jgi:hypothetical protein